MDTSPVNHKREVTGVVFLAFAVIFGISYYLPDAATGILGLVLRLVGKGLFGVTAYALPVLLIYAAIDFILEKRSDIAPKRVLSVLFVLLAISAVFPVITIERSTVEALCLDATKNTPLATNALALLWNSGNLSTLIPSTNGLPVLPGGLIGGSIALGLQVLAAKTGALVILGAFILSQIVLIFNLSLSKTAVRTAEAIKSTSQRAGGAIRTGAQNFRDHYRSPIEQGGNAGSFPVSDIDSEFSRDVPITTGMSGHTGFIDLEGTDVKMAPSSFRSDNPYDVDLSLPVRRNKPVTEDRPFEPADPFVSTDFIRPASGPLPTSDAAAVSRLPGFLSEQEDPSWINLSEEQTEADSYTTPVIQRVGTDGRYVDREAPAEETAAVRETVREEEKPTVQTTAPNQAAFAPEPKRVVRVAAEPDKAGGRQLAISFPPRAYKVPPSSLLRPDNPEDAGRSSQNALMAQGKKLEDTLASFGVTAKVINITHGPAITRFELTPGPGIKVSRIVNLTDDLALAMAAVGVRIEAPIPGKSAIGIEIPNSETSAVTLRGLIDTPTFKKGGAPLLAALGRDIPGNPIFCDLAKMPHLLIAGSTGSGKSVCINSILMSILCKASPEQVKLIMIDPKVVELSIYNGIPHLLAPVVTDPKKAANTLNWAVGEMTRRYGLFAESAVRDFRGYNEELSHKKEPQLPLILIVIDELADLMQVASKEVEESIARLTAMARAAGIHLLIATQRPSVDVITGVIKANIPSRIAFAVSSQVDSRTILDMAGAEKLLGKGDMLYYPQSAAKPQRGQGAFVSDAEVESVIEYLKAQNLTSYDPDEVEAITSATAGISSSTDKDGEEEDELLPQAVDIVLSAGCASVSILQRRMNIGYPRAARLIDKMQLKGYVGPFEGSKPRKLLITPTQWLEIQSKGG